MASQPMDYTSSSNSDTESELADMLRKFTIHKKIETVSDYIKQNENPPMPFVNDHTEVRLQRSCKQDIRLLSSKMTRRFLSHEFEVRGSTGQNYTVKIGPKLDCTCRDHRTRATHCKHILFILSQELKIQNYSSIIYVTLFPTDQRYSVITIRMCDLR
ncbi:uncharacterized protein EV154DRAFT_600588 [Mucor mucedo]|uniref:uncharacterized protein n=1 Tax=Mucor mucedo TaxID=29922 RepID=UPI00221F82ED|nr:uncharacterized protein EV154DRAFT_600588 [Mucor mucedo]KAI7893746.1 hypothetical protein EV154DRAFT_600588 [Mucor mucedo]